MTFLLQEKKKNTNLKQPNTNTKVVEYKDRNSSPDSYNYSPLQNSWSSETTSFILAVH